MPGFVRLMADSERYRAPGGGLPTDAEREILRRWRERRQPTPEMARRFDDHWDKGSD
jgi:hypothetical protein